MNTLNRTLLLTLLLLAVCALAGCERTQAACDAVTDIEGEYSCTGECVTTTNGQKQLVQVQGETDTVERYPGATAALYQVHITGSGGFRELEIGALEGLVLRTATAEVTDKLFPVLEEYIFKTDASCKATGFTKIVRNPNEGNFKACSILCTKNG